LLTELRKVLYLRLSIYYKQIQLGNSQVGKIDRAKYEGPWFAYPLWGPHPPSISMYSATQKLPKHGLQNFYEGFITKA
jgi:hypothetical protein